MLVELMCGRVEDVHPMQPIADQKPVVAMDIAVGLFSVAAQLCLGNSTCKFHRTEIDAFAPDHDNVKVE